MIVYPSQEMHFSKRPKMRIYPFGIAFAMGKDYAFEADFIRVVKLFNEPSINVDLECHLHHEDDHCPRVTFTVIILWMKLVELSIYNIHHKDKDPVLVGSDWCTSMN